MLILKIYLWQELFTYIMHECKNLNLKVMYIMNLWTCTHVSIYILKLKILST